MHVCIQKECGDYNAKRRKEEKQIVKTNNITVNTLAGVRKFRLVPRIPCMNKTTGFRAVSSSFWEEVEGEEEW